MTPGINPRPYSCERVTGSVAHPSDVLLPIPAESSDRMKMAPGINPRPYSCERVTGIEPALSAWEADVLPLNYTRVVMVESKVIGQPRLRIEEYAIPRAPRGRR
jgi:hypothetical protein